MNADELIKAIDCAFDGVPRSEITLRQFLLTDTYGLSRDITDEEWSQAGKARVDSKWQDIPDSEIEECECQLAHMQAEEFQSYLPEPKLKDTHIVIYLFNTQHQIKCHLHNVF